MASNVSALRIGARVRFRDRWQGRIAAIEVAEGWDVLNVTVESGLLAFRKRVRLPLSAAKGWDYDLVDFDAVSFEAFAGGVAATAAPARVLNGSTPVAHTGTRFSGLLVDRVSRRAEELLLSTRAGRPRRVRVSDVNFDGRSVVLTVPFANLAPYYSDGELTQKIHDAISAHPHLAPDDRRSITVTAEGGRVTIGGNVRMPTGKAPVIEAVSAVRGVVSVKDEIVDDISLEKTIGLALERAGIQRRAEVFARSNLGRVSLYGSSPSAGVTDDVIRAVKQVRGVREVINLMEQARTESRAA